MEKSIYKYILTHTKMHQVFLVVLTIASMPLVYYSLEIPKLIVNKAIGGGNVQFSVLGLTVTQIQYLFLLSGLFLLMVIINGGMKYAINVYRGVLGERMLRRFRYMLYARIQRFPLPHFKNVSPGEIIPMVTAETEPLGGFIGDAVALPVMQGGLLITYLSFIFVQDFWLGLASIALYPPQVYLIPRLQHKVNQLSKQRVQVVRRLSDRIGESVVGIADIHANDTGRYERADVSHRLGDIFSIRYEIYRRKFFIKFVNNFLALLTPFFFYSIGGYFVLQNELSLGALLGVLLAYKEVSPPWKELLKFYQISEDVKVKYAQIIEQFAPDNMLDEQRLQADADTAHQLDGKIRAQRLSYADDAGAQVDGFDFELDGAQHTLILSGDGTAADELAQLLAGLLPPSGGAVHINQLELTALPESVTGRRIGYCAPTSRVFNASLRDNLLYGLKHRALSVGANDDGGGDSDSGSESENAGNGKSNSAGDSNSDNNSDANEARRKMIKEANASGNSADDIHADWVDIAQAGATTTAEFDDIVLAVIDCVELDDELLTLALRTAEDIDIPEQLAAQIVTLRARLREQINQLESGAGAIIESLDADAYIENLSVEENLLFGTPLAHRSASEFLAQNPLAQRVLKSSGLRRDLSRIGLELAKLMVELFSDVPDDSELFEQFSFITAADLPDYRRLLGEAGERGVDALTAAQRGELARVSFKLCPARHRLDLVTAPLREKVLEARRALMRELGDDNAAIRFYDATRYNAGMSMQENLLFGKIAYAKGHLQPRVTETIRATLKQTNLDRAIILAGLNCPAGAGGSKLSGVVREKLCLARALLKNPDILIVNNLLSGLDGRGFSRILGRVIERRRNRCLIWAQNDPSYANQFDRVLLLGKNKLLRNDSPDALREEIAKL